MIRLQRWFLKPPYNYLPGDDLVNRAFQDLAILLGDLAMFLMIPEIKSNTENTDNYFQIAIDFDQAEQYGVVLTPFATLVAEIIRSATEVVLWPIDGPFDVYYRNQFWPYEWESIRKIADPSDPNNVSLGVTHIPTALVAPTIPPSYHPTFDMFGGQVFWVVYEASDVNGTKYCTDGLDKDGNRVSVCMPSFITLFHELTHVVSIASGGSQDETESEAIARQGENLLRTALGLAVRDANPSTPNRLQPPSYCWHPPPAVPDPTAGSWSWPGPKCFIASSAGADLAALRRVRKRIALESEICRDFLVSLFDEYYQYSPFLCRRMTSGTHGAREASEGIAAFWRAVLDGAEPPAQAEGATARRAGVEWLEEMLNRNLVGPLSGWALVDPARMMVLGLSSRAIEEWWYRLPWLCGAGAGGDPVLDGFLQRAKAPFRSDRIAPRPSFAIPRADDLSIVTERAYRLRIENVGRRPLFVAPRFSAGVTAPFDDSIVIMPGEEGFMPVGPFVSGVEAAFQPKYPGINVDADGRWRVAIAVDP
ncbi:hypothetical protein [Sorangium sp. So ce128]|uniref:hypothetical protein n=1 Tax=Sorangium sp. So ce128 TaxID=3133281 RepID=UPI003F647A80